MEERKSSGSGQLNDWNNATREELCNIMRIVITNDEASKEEREEFVCHVLMIADEREEVKR